MPQAWAGKVHVAFDAQKLQPVEAHGWTQATIVHARGMVNARAAATYAARTPSTSCRATLSGAVKTKAGAPATPSKERRREMQSRGRPSMARCEGERECGHEVLRLMHWKQAAVAAVHGQVRVQLMPRLVTCVNLQSM